MDNPSYIMIRLTFGIVSQVWCSFITFPLYVIITQMGSRFKRAVISEGVRKSLHGWRKRVRARQQSNSNSNSARLSSSSSMPLIRDMDRYGSSSNRSSTDISTSSGRRSWRNEGSRRWSLMDYGDVGAIFTSQQPSYEDRGGINCDSDTGSDSSYNEEDYNVRDGARYSRIP
ncbi:MLO-like protein 4 [Chenopodium quinoa]|nr:MLO-like protein 4 [Chenopodium quinoa]